MNRSDELKSKLQGHKEELRVRYRVKSMGLFGSVVRGEAGPDSDVDILIEFEEPIGFFRFLELEEHLADLLGVKVDLVSRQALKPHIGKHILREVVPV